MPGTLFLDALEKRRKLTKGFPMGDGTVRKPDVVLPDLPDEQDLYRQPSLLDRAIGRLKAAVKPQMDPSLPGKHNIQNRRDAEKSPEGNIRRDPNDLTNQGVLTSTEEKARARIKAKEGR